MEKSILKRALSLLICFAVLIAGMPLALMNVSAASNIIFDDFEGENNWTFEDATEPNANCIVTVGEGEEANKVFVPAITSDPGKILGLGNADIYTYNKALPTTKIVSVTGKFLQTTVSATYGGLVIVYYYKDADNWRGLCITGESKKQYGQDIRYCGREDGTQYDFATYATITYGGTLTGVKNLETTFTINYAADGTATMVFENSTGTSPAISLLTWAKGFTGSIKANEGQFAIGNSNGWNANPDYFDDIKITYELTVADEAASFLKKHNAIISKQTLDVTAADADAIANAIADYEVLSADAKDLLADEYAIIKAHDEKLYAAQFNVDSFTEDFSGNLNWSQVGSGEAATINSSGAFVPSVSTDLSTAKLSLYTHRYWPDRALKSVKGTQANSYESSLIIYYYKDENNWRGFWFRNTTNMYLFQVAKATDPADSNKVYYYLSEQNLSSLYLWNSSDANKPAYNNTSIPRLTFEIIYPSDSSIQVQYSYGENKGNLVTVSGAITSLANKTYVSTDGGKNFSLDATATYTFPAITDAKSAQFGMGHCRSTYKNSFDDITFNFERAAEDIASDFCTKYETLLSKDETTVTNDDKSQIIAALGEYDGFSAEVKALLSNEYTLLSKMSEALYSNVMGGETYTEDFEDANLWECSGSTTGESAVIIEGETENYVFAPVNTSLSSLSKPTVYTHRYWQDKLLLQVEGTMYIGSNLSANVPSDMIIYYYEDSDNWRGFYFVGDAASGQNVRFIGRENGRAATFPQSAYFSAQSLALKNHETKFTITYAANGTASILLENETGSQAIELVTASKGYEGAVCYLEAINANYGAFGMGSVSNAANDNWFDDITFTFGDTFEKKANDFKTEYDDTLALDANDVQTTDKAAIAALYDAYELISRSSKMEELLAAEGVKTKALFDALIKAHKTDDDIIRIACVGDSITEGHQNYSISYPKQLQDKLNEIYGEGVFLVGNFGVSGATAGSYFTTTKYKESLYFNPDIVITMLGTNDVSIGIEIFEHYYQKLANVYLSQESVDYFVAATSIITNNASHDASLLPIRREKVKTLATENGWRIFDMCDATDDLLLADTTTNYKDQLHPTKIGYGILADATLNYLKDGAYGTPADSLFEKYGVSAVTSKEFEEFEETYNTTADAVTAENLEKIEEALAKYETLTDAQKETYAEEKAALEQIKVVATFDKEVKETVVTPANVDVVAEKQAAYEALGVDNASIKDAIKALNDTVNSFSSQVLGCSIKVDADPTKQDLRFEYAAPTWDAPEGWYVKEIGAIFYPAAALNGQPLTLETPYKESKGIKFGEGAELPETITANLVGSAGAAINCEMDIAGTAYVIWTDGTNEYIRYSNTKVDNSGYTESDVVDGIGVRSVYKTARKIATAIYGTTEYGEVVYTEAVKAGGNVADFADADLLEFVSKNLDAITAYVGKNQNK